MDELFKVTDLHVYYNMIHAIHGISSEVKYGEVVTLIDANGTDKTIMLHTITGLLPPSSDEAVYNGQSITHALDYQLIRRGLAYMSEGRRAFSQLSVLQGLELGAFTRRSKEEKTESLKEIYCRFPRLAEQKNQLAGTLSGGEQQMLAMGRALVSEPGILVPDEPLMEPSPTYANEIFDIIKSVHESGTMVLLVEQNAEKALLIANRVYVFETGTIRFSDAAEELLRSTEVKNVYLSE